MTGNQNSFSIPTDAKMNTLQTSDVANECEYSEVEGVVKLEIDDSQLPNPKFIYKTDEETDSSSNY